MTNSNTLRVIVCIAGMTAAAPVLAQYDRDGRYVPSPMGVPADPYARPIPNYPGTPGAATGTPIWPRGAIPQMPPPVTLTPPPASAPSYESLPVVPLSKAQCQDGWSRRTGVSRVEFKRRCALLLRRDKKRDD